MHGPLFLPLLRTVGSFVERKSSEGVNDGPPDQPEHDGVLSSKLSQFGDEDAARSSSFGGDEGKPLPVLDGSEKSIDLMIQNDAGSWSHRSDEIDTHPHLRKLHRHFHKHINKIKEGTASGLTTGMLLSTSRLQMMTKRFRR